tara:strand:- start:221 stop:475 length:255 start_codon:yes stop_codon:yes gene_type:complete
MNKVSISKLIKHSSLIEINLNEIHKVLSVGNKADESIIKDLVKDIEGWRECLVELDFYISSNYQLNMKSDNYEYDDTSKEVIIY